MKVWNTSKRSVGVYPNMLLHHKHRAFSIRTIISYLQWICMGRRVVQVNKLWLPPFSQHVYKEKGDS